MKKPSIAKYAVVLVLMAGLVAFTAPSAKAQSNTTTIDAVVTIAQAIGITGGATLDFATVSAPVSGGPGTILVTTGGSFTAGGGSLVISGTPVAGRFDVTGVGNATYSITGPIVEDNFTATGLSLGTLTRNPSMTGALTGGGTESIDIGGTLSITTFATAGVNGGGNPAKIRLTVNYN